MTLRHLCSTLNILKKRFYTEEHLSDCRVLEKNCFLVFETHSPNQPEKGLNVYLKSPFQQYNMVTFIRQKSTAVQKEMSFTIPGVSSGHKQNLVILSQALKKLFIDGVEGTGQFPKDNSRYAQEKRLKKKNC